MLDQGLVHSGFDAEILLGERQITYLLLALIDAGTLDTTFMYNGIEIDLAVPPDVDRTYEPNPDAYVATASADAHAFETEILFDHPTGADIRVHAAVVAAGLRLEGDLFAALAFSVTRDETGALEKATIGVTVLDIESDSFPLIEASFPTATKAAILAAVKEKADQQLDLGSLGAFKRVQDLSYRKLDTDGEHPRALGLYLNLRLQTGPRPDSLKDARGDITTASNFLPAGSDCAMASRVGLYGDLAIDGYQRFAEIDEHGHASYPWRKSPFNKSSEKIGTIVDVDVTTIPGGNILKIDVEVEYQIDDFPDPNANLVLMLTPSADANGVMKWQVDADFHASIVLELIGFAVLAGLTVLSGGIFGLGFGAAMAGGLIGGSLLDLAGHELVDLIYSGRVEKKAEAALPDIINGRVEVGSRRWDPFYTTHHVVGMRMDGSLINAAGVALWGKAAIDRTVEPLASAVIRDKIVQTPEPPTQLRYRIWDAESLLADFAAVTPGTDRRPVAQSDSAEPTLYDLTIDQIVDRMAEGRIVPNLAYVAKRVWLIQHQVHGLLVISDRERNEVRNRLVDAFTQAKRAEIDADQGAQIRADLQAEFDAAGTTPTQEEFDARLGEILDGLVAPFTKTYIEGPLDTELEPALVPELRLCLPPENIGALQKKGILHLLELELITMHGGLLYYRDHPDFYTPDNLMSRPHYTEGPDGLEFP